MQLQEKAGRKKLRVLVYADFHMDCKKLRVLSGLKPRTKLNSCASLCLPLWYNWSLATVTFRSGCSSLSRVDHTNIFKG